MSNNLLNVVEEAVKNHIETSNRKLYQFEKNKLYDYLGTALVNRLKMHKCFIAGGAITSLFTGTKINDLDIYFRNEDLCVKFVEDSWEDRDDWINMLTKKSILMRVEDKEIQVIHFNFFESAQEIFDSFDFTVCMGAFDFETEQFTLHEEFLKHNSQRIIKFNKNTAFPVVSLLRVHKYNNKSYTISKPEFLRIAMKCMDLDIKNAEQLKDHLGGMYGINYDKIIKFSEGEEFSLDKVIDKIEDLCLDEDYFKKPEEVKFDDLDDVIDTIKKKNIKITTIKDKVYKIRYNNTLSVLALKPAFYDEVSGKEYIENNKFYKFVEKEDNTYKSHWDSNFTYKIGEIAEAKGDFLYFNEKNEIDKSSYKFNGALLEVKIEYDDFQKKYDNNILAKKCFVVREVPKDEYMKWVNEEEEGCPFED
ncbi:hypothetical protein [Paenibacillus oleatilyticus]|uniref:hypothetical protein n=1 Tax=Paenibacillus oleatilyticus TaxID=2594886 RepID=UPI001C1F8970|nr:hypothetical protein [Paenibacillus oleatilyticus]MBU7315951.1 hypothetical protein [Paenibacillus oleatilyticus]